MGVERWSVTSKLNIFLFVGCLNKHHSNGDSKSSIHQSKNNALGGFLGHLGLPPETFEGIWGTSWRRSGRVLGAS